MQPPHPGYVILYSTYTPLLYLEILLHLNPPTRKKNIIIYFQELHIKLYELDDHFLTRDDKKIEECGRRTTKIRQKK